jgi:cobalamin biosynthesis Mg chelatase CobN
MSDNWSNAGGLRDAIQERRASIEGQHKVCTRRCKLFHPFSKKKQTACKNKCNDQRALRLKQEAAYNSTDVANSSMWQQLGNQGYDVALAGEKSAGSRGMEVGSQEQASVMSTKNIIIGVAALAVIGGVIYFARKK